MTTRSQISVIIPVYNTSEYIKECLDSILQQTYSNFEVICVDDGSDDNSLSILRQYQEKDSRIKVYSQDNQGTAKAREKAIKEAKGEWIAYIDSDDYVSEDYLKKLYECAQAEKADEVFCYYYEDIEGKLKKHKKKIRYLKISKIGKYPYATGACCLIKKTFFDKIQFPKNCCYGEDSSISTQIALQRPSIAIIPEYLYFYRRHKKSVVLNKTSVYKQIASILSGYEAIENFCKSQHGIGEKAKPYIHKQIQKRVQEIIEGESK